MKLTAVVELANFIARIIRTAVTKAGKSASRKRKEDARDDPVGQWNDTVAGGVRGDGDGGDADADEGPGDESRVPTDGASTAAGERGRSVAGIVGHDRAADLLRGSQGVPGLIAAPVQSPEGDQPPLRKTAGAAGYDLPAGESFTLEPGEQKLVGTGWRLALPAGYCATVWPRSGLALKNRLDRRAGLIDNDYRGEIKAMLVNEGEEPIAFDRGDRIAQLKLEPLIAFEVYRADTLPDGTERGSGGFGSTGGSNADDE